MTLAASLLEGYGYNGITNTSDIGNDPILYLQEACIEAVNALYEASQQYYIADIIGQVEVVTESNGNVEAIQESAGSKLKQIWEAFKRKVKEIIDKIISKIRQVAQWIRNKLFGKSKDENGSIEKTSSNLIKELETFDPTAPSIPKSRSSFSKDVNNKREAKERGEDPVPSSKSQRKSSPPKMNYSNFKEDEALPNDEPLVIKMPGGNSIEVEPKDLKNDMIPIADVIETFQFMAKETGKTLNSLDDCAELCDTNFEDLKKLVDSIKFNRRSDNDLSKNIFTDDLYGVDGTLTHTNEYLSNLNDLLHDLRSRNSVIFISKDQLANHISSLVKFERDQHDWMDEYLNELKERERKFQMFQKEVDSINLNDYNGLGSELNKDAAAITKKISTYISGYVSVTQCHIRIANIHSVFINEELNIIRRCWEAYKSYMSKHNR